MKITLQNIAHNDSGEPCATVKAEGTAGILYDIATVEPQELSTYFRQVWAFHFL